MRVICGIGSPRTFQGLRALLQLAWVDYGRLISVLEHLLVRGIGWARGTSSPSLAAWTLS
jgi:hypothetical protein